jgi:hypothetical protein
VLNSNFLIITFPPSQEPLKSADEVIKEIDDMIECEDEEDEDEQDGDGGGGGGGGGSKKQQQERYFTP